MYSRPRIAPWPRNLGGVRWKSQRCFPALIATSWLWAQYAPHLALGRTRPSAAEIFQSRRARQPRPHGGIALSCQGSAGTLEVYGLFSLGRISTAEPKPVRSSISCTTFEGISRSSTPATRAHSPKDARTSKPPASTSFPAVSPGSPWRPPEQPPVLARVCLRSGLPCPCMRPNQGLRPHRRCRPKSRPEMPLDDHRSSD